MSTTLEDFRRWQRTEAAIAKFIETRERDRERLALAVAAHQSDIDYRRERGLEPRRRVRP